MVNPFPTGDSNSISYVDGVPNAGTAQAKSIIVDDDATADGDKTLVIVEKIIASQRCAYFQKREN